MKVRGVSKKDVTLGLLLGLGFGLPVLIVMVFLLGPWRSGAAPAEMTPVSVPNTVVPVMSPAATSTPTPVVVLEPTVTIAPTSPIASATITHVIGPGEVLGGIAYDYGISLDALMAANGIADPDLVWAGQTVVIPGVDFELTAGSEEVAVATPLPELEAADDPWEFSLLEGDLGAAYPATAEMQRFTVHYTPGTFPEEDLSNVKTMIQRGLEHIEGLLETPLSGTFDVYVAGSVFAPSDQALRGRSFSAARRYFFLHDGTGNPADQQYIATHELTHLYSWNTFGRPVSAMLSEGLAVYTGMALIADSDHLPIRTFCAAYHQAGRLPRVSSNLGFYGHIRDLDNYYAAGCFVEYLIETYGPAQFGQLYPTGDYASVYGKSLAALEADWIADLEAEPPAFDFDPTELVTAVDKVGAAYEELFAGFSGTSVQRAAYLEIDAARIALLEGRFSDVDIHLRAFEETLGY